MSRHRATYVATLVPFPIGVMLNSASMPREGPGGLIRVGAVARPMGVDYSGLAATYDRTRSPPRGVTEFWLPAVGLDAGVTSSSRLLDVGCGTGRLAVPLSARCRVVGVDVSREMIGVARAKGSPATFILGEAGRLPFRDRTFDTALAVMVVHLVPDVRVAIHEIARVAGRAVIPTNHMGFPKKNSIDQAFPCFDAIDRGRI